MKKLIDNAAQTVKFTFDEGLDPVVFDAAVLNEETRLHAMLAGCSHKIGDNAAISKSEANGWNVTEAMRREAVLQMVEQLGRNEWNAKTRAPVRHPSIVKLAAKWGCTYEEAELKIASLDDI
jgi:hypothetical protein